MSKEYGTGKIAVDLGHNGAGKTSTMSMLMEMIEPSKVDATIFGKSVYDDLDQVR